MKTVILGANGMLGHDLLAALGRSGLDATGMDLPELDITRADELDAKIPGCDCVINCAAFTRVDDAEAEVETANAVNAEGAGNVARVCAARGIRILQISTDYVFGGMSDKPYIEDDATSPINAYGSSKLSGEHAVQAAACKSLIVRTESLFGVNGRNFVSSIAAKLRGGSDLVTVVSDQTVAPTYTVHLADAVLALMRSGREGTVHVCASGSCTWFEFAEAIAEAIGHKGRITPISSSELAMAARRPAYSVLDTARYSEWTGLTMPSWREGLMEYLGEVAGI